MGVLDSVPAGCLVSYVGWVPVFDADSGWWGW